DRAVAAGQPDAVGLVRAIDPQRAIGGEGVVNDAALQQGAARHARVMHQVEEDRILGVVAPDVEDNRLGLEVCRQGALDMGVEQVEEVLAEGRETLAGLDQLAEIDLAVAGTGVSQPDAGINAQGDTTGKGNDVKETTDLGSALEARVQP